jgi:hypothetical protein
MNPIPPAPPIKAVPPAKKARRNVQMMVMDVPTVPVALVTAAKTVAAVAAIGAAIVTTLPVAPAWLPFALSALASVAAYLGGQSAPAMQLPGGPLVPVTAVPVLLAASSAVAATATHAQGWHSGALLLIASVLAGIAGKAGPQQAVPIHKDGGTDVR